MSVLLPVATVLACALLVCVWVLWHLRGKVRAVESARQREQGRVHDLEHLARRNAAILENAMDGFFVLGRDYQFIEVNPAFCRMTGYSEDELLAMKMTDLEVAAGADGSSDVAYWRTGLHHFATSHRHKDGHIIQLESCVVVLRDSEQKILVGFARDVTERYRAEQALRESERQYRNLVETSRDLIWSLDLEGRWTFVNNAARSIYGYDPDEMLGRPIMDFIRPERVEGARQILSELRDGKPRLSFETEHTRKDGTTVNLSFNAIPVRDDYGNVVGSTGTATDVTLRKRAERSLREANDRFESLVAGMPLGYIVWSKDFKVLEWNPAASAIFGYSAAEAYGRKATDLIVPKEGEQAFHGMSKSLLTGTVCEGSLLVNCRQDGERISCEWYNTVLPDAVGGVQAVATMVRDVSERERLETQLRQSQKLESLGVLAGGVAHDFNNLLVGIMGNASLAIEQTGADSPLRPMLDRIVNASQRATDLTQRMLAYAGRAACDVKVMDLNQLVEELADFASAAIPKRVQLRIKTAEKLPLIKADSGQVQQIIMNLLINAAEAIGHDEGSVSISTWEEALDREQIATQFAEHKMDPGTYVCLEVRDTGCGMSPEILTRVFDPFFTTKFAGRGLGLSAILGIVRAHRGAITFSSELGAGTVFRVFLPAITAKEQAPTRQRRAPRVPLDATVLVIDDEEDVRDVVEAVLSSRGMTVLVAEDGRRGIEVFREHADEVDAVLLDINMPGMNGEAVFHQLRTIKPDVRVILSTGYSEQEAASQFANASLAGFVNKPYTASALVEKIGEALDAQPTA